MKTSVFLTPDGTRTAVGRDSTRYSDAYTRAADTMSELARQCFTHPDIGAFGAWGLSDDNIRKRPAGELQILRAVIHRKIDQLERDLQTPDFAGVRTVHLGDRALLASLDPALLARVDDLRDMTKDRAGKLFILALAHGGDEELHRAETLTRVLDYEYYRNTIYASNPPPGIEEDEWTKAICRYLELRRTDTPRLEDFLDINLRGMAVGQRFAIDIILRTGTDSRHGYTSNVLKMYRGTKTHERYFSEGMPDVSLAAMMDSITEYLAAEKREGK